MDGTCREDDVITEDLRTTGGTDCCDTYGAGAGKEHAIKGLVAEKLPMRIECNLHSWMKGHVGIFSHPYFAVTDKDGNFEIKDAPAGNFRLMVWHDSGYGPAGRDGSPIAVKAGGTTEVPKIEMTMK